ncbi:hypothetical protein CYFUS_004473 [Cystobacter fuscus]|uniref:Baseplate protein J-like domain-containing protein n=1 Tax=Cystobacter fuscus TaxID=43 RepID=A0A250J527_9BACT|nr:hypothetical protein [Cystobacter fuscus]ATB39034.1 hypothetical protein CYFUS_004473 [Cystobacter fuscus]
MAETPYSEIVFEPGLPGCGRRVVRGLPRPLPDVGNDFDWQVRDYDGFRLFMMEELAARFPERQRWTAADLEVVLVEAMAAVLDQLSDMADRVAAEAYLETARRPESVRRLLRFIGYDAERMAFAAGEIKSNPADDEAGARAELEAAWAGNPFLMEAARQAGPRELHVQHRMVTVEDYGRLLEEHPLVRHAQASIEWSGSWSVVRVAVIGWNDRRLDTREGSDASATVPLELRRRVERFHIERGLMPPQWTDATFRAVLASYVERYRMIGQEVQLEDAVPVGILLGLSIRVAPDYFQSEVRAAIEQALGRAPGGFFEPGRLRFGEDINASDLIQALTALEGVETVFLDRFKRVGSRYLDQAASGRILLKGIEIATCDNDPAHPERGAYTLKLQGGRRG